MSGISWFDDEQVEASQPIASRVSATGADWQKTGRYIASIMDHAAVLAELLRRASSLDADVHFRSLALQRQCDTLERVCAFLRGLESSGAEREAARQAETSALEQSIDGAIQRARRVRAELTGGAGGSNCESDDDHAQPSDAQEQQLRDILEVAKATRAAQQAQQTAEPKAEAAPVRLEYPRKLKALETQLQERRLKEQEASTRFAFCCKMSEHLSLGSKRRQLIVQQQQKVGAGGRMDVPVARIQVSFPKQVARLRGGYQRLAEFMLEKVEVGSPKFQQVADAPTFASVFPIYHRLKQVLVWQFVLVHLIRVLTSSGVKTVGQDDAATVE
ncbi:unnamed protein product [Phytophthora fragariaefolia]|uniref:Unnamed protein product n=1 Tax=Phytophthora fragariaefolia TaxID=1490495 RepID=A0A9W7D4K1_9STRA|nr:unnamed protein product [Phytophthora fragariaefolia]